MSETNLFRDSIIVSADSSFSRGLKECTVQLPKLLEQLKQSFNAITNCRNSSTNVAGRLTPLPVHEGMHGARRHTQRQKSKVHNPARFNPQPSAPTCLRLRWTRAAFVGSIHLCGTIKCLGWGRKLECMSSLSEQKRLQSVAGRLAKRIEW